MVVNRSLEKIRKREKMEMLAVKENKKVIKTKGGRIRW